MKALLYLLWPYKFNIKTFQMSYSSYKSKYQSDVRAVTPLSQLPNNLHKQMEIQELDHKVDVILQHNELLKEENQALKRKIVFLEGSNRGSASRASFSISDKRDFQLKIIELQQAKKQSIADKELFTAELDSMTTALNVMADKKDALEMQKKQLQTKIFSLRADQELERKRTQQEHKKQLYEENLKKNVEKNEQLNKLKKYYFEEVQQLKEDWEAQKGILHEQKLQALNNLQNKYEKEIFQVKKHFQENCRDQIQKIENAAIDKCRRERQKAEEYVQNMLENHQKMEAYNQEELKKEIQNLKNSLESRQKVIESLLHHQVKPENERYYEQAQELRVRIKELTESFFKEAELLKVKMAIKHEADVQEVSKAFGDRLDISHARIKNLELDNERLRENYEQQVRSKVKLRQKFDIETSKMKNVIRKMKVQLESYGKELRLNIDGIKDQANSFSMSMLTQLSQEKTKKIFNEEQIRKMREVLDMKEQEIGEITKNCSQKVKYYEQKFEGFKKKISQLKEQLEEKEARYAHDLEERDNWAKIQLQKEQTHLGDQIQHYLKELEDEKEKYDELQEETQKLKAIKKQRENQIQQLHHQLDLSKAHIEALRLQMQMFASNVKPDEALLPLKEHYQRIIQEMEKDKQVLKQTNEMQANQITKLVTKYQDLERTLQKTLSTMKKHSQLNQKVMQLGMDTNLVKNLAEVFQAQN